MTSKYRYFMQNEHETPQQIKANFSSAQALDVPTKASRLDRLPTLFEVLNRKTTTPVDLWSFYVYMRDSQCAIDYLDFWLDAIQHLELCKNYVRGLRTSLISRERDHRASDIAQVAQSRNEASNENFRQGKSTSMSSSVLLEMVMQEGLLDDTDSHRLSDFLRGKKSVENLDPQVKELIEKLPHPYTPEGSKRISVSPETLEVLVNQGPNANRYVTRDALHSSCKNLFYTYFMDNAEKKLVISDYIVRKIKHSIEKDGRDDPALFDEAKEYVFKAMENEAYPNFLQQSAICNVMATSYIVRLFLGGVLMFIGFWIGYIFIFLNWRPKPVRAVVTIPFFLGGYALLSAFFKLDPLLCFMGFSESKASHGGLIRIREPFVKRLLLKRGLWVLALSCLVSACFSVLFALVPGRRI